MRSSRRSSVQPICVLRLWNRDSAVLKAANQRNIDIFQQVRQFFALPFDPAEALEQRASVKLADRIYLETAEKFAWPDIEQADLSDEVFCYGLRDQFGVLADRDSGALLPRLGRQYPAGQRPHPAAHRDSLLPAGQGAV